MSKEKVFISPHIIKEYRKLLKLCKESIHIINISYVRLAFTMINKASIKDIIKFYGPLLIHSLQIAQIVTSEIGLGTDSILCALLYKFIENESIERIKIEEAFSNKILSMSDELNKISKIDSNNKLNQAENFRKLLLTLTSDIRVILIKLAERLYVMRNLDFEDAESQKRIANETFNLYAPIGHRLGMHLLKTELEDLSMKFTNSKMYDFISVQLQETSVKRNRFIREIISPIKLELDSNGFDYEIKSRTKSVFSIWNKMNKKNVELNEVFDVFAIRIILNSNSINEKSDCWNVFSIVTSLYQPNPKRMRDWISKPKYNGYESLHTTVLVPGEKWVEVQIRSKRMDEIAEKGLAAHWKYKGQKSTDSFDAWLKKMSKVLEIPDTSDPHYFESAKLNNDLNEIFVFTPKGDLRKLRKGSTVLDFAYDIHSDIGDKCTGARVNGKNVPIRFVLSNGDKVEIQTSKNQTPKSDWLEFVKTSKAKSKIKFALKEEKQKEADNGKEIFKRRMRNWKLPFNDLIISKLLRYFKLKNSIDFYSLIANENITMSEIKNFLITTEANESKTTEKIGDLPIEKIMPVISDNFENVLIIDEKILNNVDYKLAKCCNPILGDEIFGFVTISEGIKIHRLNCPNASQMIKKYGYRVLKAHWSESAGHNSFHASIKLIGENEVGILSKLSDIITKDSKVNLRSINIDTTEDQFEGIIKLFVKDVNHLEMLIHKLMKIKGIKSAQRYDII